LAATLGGDVAPADAPRLSFVKPASRGITSAMTGPSATILSILMLAAFLLAGGGTYLMVKRRERHKGALMLLAAAVMLGNVLIWTV
jgi:LPXTG-motif cell wall-anchored protein